MSRYLNSEIHPCPVAEGVRVRIGNAAAFAVRNRNKDLSVRIRRERRPARQFARRIPFVRGIVRLFDTVFGFLDSVSESGELQPQDIAKGTRFEQKFSDLFRLNPVGFVAFLSGLIVPVIMIGLILGIPMAADYFLLPYLTVSRTAENIIICAFRLLGVLISVPMVMRLRIMNRFCMYNGAIGKVLNAYERHGRQITYEAAMKESYLSRKSDFAFLMSVVLLSIIAFAFVRTYTLHIQVIVRILIVFAVAAISTEPLRALEDLDTDSPLVILLFPHMLLSRMFTIEPHPQMVEVALCAFNAARENNIEHY